MFYIYRGKCLHERRANIIWKSNAVCKATLCVEYAIQLGQYFVRLFPMYMSTCTHCIYYVFIILHTA